MPETVPCCKSFNFELESDTWVANYCRVSALHASLPGGPFLGSVVLTCLSLVNRWLSKV